MDGRTFVTAVIGAAIGLVAGFLISNSINRNELTSLRAENELLKTEKSTTGQSSQGDSLTPEEIEETIRRADANPKDFQTQMNVGVAMYRYAAMKQDAALVQRSIPILERAASLRPDDADVALTLGNAYFDVGYFGKDNSAFTNSQKYYTKTLSLRPNNPDVIVDLGLTYFLQSPPDHESAVREFRRSLDIDPKHEKSLQFMIQTLIKQNKTSEAAGYLQQLRAVNPQNQAIAELTSMLATSQPAG